MKVDFSSLDEKPAGVEPHDPVGDFVVGQLWQEVVNGGQLTCECVVVAVGAYDVVLGVLSASPGLREVAGPGATIVHNRNYIWNYWRQIS